MATAARMRWWLGGAAVMIAAALAPRAGADEPRNPLRAHRTTISDVFDTFSATERADDALTPVRRVAVTLTDDSLDAALWPDALAADPAPLRSVIATQGPLDELLLAPADADPKALLQAEPFAIQPHAEPPPGVAADYGDVFPAAGWVARRVHHWFRQPWFAHSDPNDPLRHVGLGQPLIGTSWRNRPLFFGAFVGGLLTGNLTSDIYQNDTPFLGLRLGCDFDHYWGLEGRWAFARPELETRAGEPLDFSRDYFADVSLVHYPFGDAAWRPYLLAGLGFQTYRFTDASGQRIAESVVSLPLGFGVKYYCGPWFTLRFDFVDNIGFGNSRVNSMHNVGLMAGAEYRFGGRRPSYYPWHNNLW